MSRSKGEDLLPVDPEIEKTCRKNRKETKKAKSQARETMAGDGRVVNANQRALKEYAMPGPNDQLSGIVRPAIQANNFELKPALIQMLLGNQFSGLESEDPNQHISTFLEICDTFKHAGVSDDAIRLRLFPFSLRGKAKGWAQSLPPGSVTTWDMLREKFLFKYFPPVRTAKLRNEITAFTQWHSESLYEAWERFKELIRKCPHHGLDDWLQLQTFYNGLDGTTKSLVDAAAGGSLNGKTYADAYALIEEMAANQYSWPTERSTQKKAFGVHEVDAFTTLSAQVASLSKQIGSLTSNMNAPSAVCEFCRDLMLVLNAKMGVCLLQQIQKKHIMWEIMIDLRIMHSPTPTIKDREIILIFHGGIIRIL